MSFEDSIVWALGVRPSALNEVYWSHSLHDLTTLVRLKSEESAAGVYQDYETLRLAIAEALGGDSGSDDSDTVETFSDLASAFTALGGSLG